MSNSVITGLADAVRQQSVQAGVETPAVRGADWRTATVQTVNADGTVTTSDGIVARRLQSYVGPRAGDKIVVTINSSGNWYAAGRTAPVSTAGTWQPLTLSGSWSAWGSPYWSPAYRINGDGTASLCGLARAPATAATPQTVATLPAAATPSSKSRFVCEISSSGVGVLDINTNGTVQILDYSGNASWASLDVARYRLI